MNKFTLKNIKEKFILFFISLFLISCNNTVSTPKNYDKISDYIGSTWINRLDGTSIHFKNSNTIVFHILVDANSEYSPRSFLRKETSSIYNEASNTFSVKELDAIPDVSLVYKAEGSKKYLEGIDQFWRLENSEEVVKYLK